MDAILGMLYSSAFLDDHAIEKKGESYSFGITQSAQILAGQAAELALKLAFEKENPGKVAPTMHQLDCLFRLLKSDSRQYVEADYSRRIQQHKHSPIKGWQMVREVFHSRRDYPVLFRFLTEEGRPSFVVQPQFLREAVCSVLALLGQKVQWNSGSSEGT